MLKFIFDLQKIPELPKQHYQDVFIFLDALISKHTPTALIEINPTNVEDYFNDRTTCLPVNGGVLIRNNNTDKYLRIVIEKLYLTILQLLPGKQTPLYSAIFKTHNVFITSLSHYSHYQYLLFLIDMPVCKDMPKLEYRPNYKHY